MPKKSTATEKKQALFERRGAEVVLQGAGGRELRLSPWVHPAPADRGAPKRALRRAGV